LDGWLIDWAVGWLVGWLIGCIQEKRRGRSAVGSTIIVHIFKKMPSVVLQGVQLIGWFD
jgi:hypothetical protein